MQLRPATRRARLAQTRTPARKVLVKSDLDHLPQSKQQELARIQRILLDEFEAAIEAELGGRTRR